MATGERLLTIGEFARRVGVSPKALRHYDALGLLRPAVVDEASRYRLYGEAQLERGRTVAHLRGLDVPLETIAAILAAGDRADADTVRTLLLAHRARLAEDAARLQIALTGIGRVIDGKESLVSAPVEIVEPAVHRRLAVDLFNHVWTLLARPARTRGEDDEMLHAAHASRHHWAVVGEPVNLARGEWQCSRVYSVLGRAEPALHHARRCLEICEEHGIADFDIAYAYEALARAHVVAGDADAARAHATRAREAGRAIAEDDDRELLESDLATLEI